MLILGILMKKITLKKQIAYSGAGVCLVVTLLAIGVFASLRIISSSAGDVIHNDKSTIFLKQRLIDHLTWMNQLGESILARTPFAGQTDPTKCKLGDWYYGIKKSSGYSSLDPELKSVFDPMEEPHARLHNAARKIVKAGGIREETEIFTREVKPAVMEVQKHLNNYIDITEKRSERSHHRITGNIRNINISLIVLTAAIIALAAFFIYGLSQERSTPRLRRSRTSIYMLSPRRALPPLETVKVNCSEMGKCGKTDCAMYEKANNSCFMSVGSYAPMVKKRDYLPGNSQGKIQRLP